MTEQQKQAILDQLTGLETQLQAYTQAIHRLLFSDHGAAPHSEETTGEIIRRKDTMVKHLRSINARLKCRSLGNSRRGFASMDKTKRTVVAGRAGKRAHATGKAHTFSREEAQRAGRIGGKGRRGKTAQSTD